MRKPFDINKQLVAQTGAGMPKEVKEVGLVGGLQIVKDIELVKIKVIKEKYVEQMNTLTVDELKDRNNEIVGRTRAFVLFRKPPGEIKRLHQSDMLTYFRELIMGDGKEIGYQEAIELSNWQLEKIALIFEE